MEEDVDVPGIEEAARSFGIRIIRSFNFLEGFPDDLAQRLDKLRRVGDEIPKATLNLQSLDDVTRIYKLAEQMDGRDKILLGLGTFGLNTRLLAEKLKSCFVYVSVTGEPDFPLASPGQFDPVDLVETYHFRNIKAGSHIYAGTGWPLDEKLRPEILNKVFDEQKDDAVYVPFPTDSFSSFLRLADVLNIQGVSVSDPYKDNALSCLARRSVIVEKIGTCNTLLRIPEQNDKGWGWEGYNTDLQAFSDTLLSALKRNSFAGLRLTLVGAGAEARAAAAAIYRLHGKALILDRIDTHARALAKSYRFKWARFDVAGLALMERYRDVIVLALEGGAIQDNENTDSEFSLLDYSWVGDETVINIVAKPSPAGFLDQARAAGCKVVEGREVLYRETAHQYQLFTGKEFPAHILQELARGTLFRRR
jgi:3-dehydroquinate dehydratase/shikimate dehydrogenase